MALEKLFSQDFLIIFYLYLNEFSILGPCIGPKVIDDLAINNLHCIRYVAYIFNYYFVISEVSKPT